jgi:hypothetical protein
MEDTATTQTDAELNQEPIETPKEEPKQENSYNELPDWARRRMGELAAEKNAAKQKLEEYQNQSHQPEQNYAPQENIQELAMTYAKQIAAQQVQEQSFVAKMTEIEKNAKAEFGDVYDK